MDQVYLYYEKCIKYELEKQQSQAITIANALIYTTPASEKSQLQKKQKAWENFINSLDIEYTKKKKEKKKQTIGDFKKMLRGAGLNIPIMQPKKEAGDS